MVYGDYTIKNKSHFTQSRLHLIAIAMAMAMSMDDGLPEHISILVFGFGQFHFTYITNAAIRSVRWLWIQFHFSPDQIDRMA